MSPPNVPVVVRFYSFVEATDTCWLWRGSLNAAGYGRISVNGRGVKAHRWSYEHFVGPIPEGLVIDHLCRVRHCVNPDHMEPVTRGENVLRGVGLSALNARKTHCRRSHPYDEANTYWSGAGTRRCRACDLLARERRAAKTRSKAHDFEEAGVGS